MKSLCDNCKKANGGCAFGGRSEGVRKCNAFEAKEKKRA